MDGIKFRTRAGMGRCQGGFCAWRCMRLLSEAAGMPIERVTKRGGGSWIAIPRLDEASTAQAAGVRAEPDDAGTRLEEGVVR
jgi:glycerol-3-phosphate dehydrogenase